LLSVSRSSRFTASSKWATCLFSVAVFLLVAFKHGFVAVMNVSGAFASLAVYLLIIGFLCMDRVSCLVTIYRYGHYSGYLDYS
jgi:hypothetical protein